jgi:hypothetical protein
VARLRGVELRLRGLQLLQRLVVDRAAGDVALEQVGLPRLELFGLRQCRLRGGDIGLASLQRVLLVLRVKPCNEATNVDPVAGADCPLHQLAVDAEGEADLVPCPDLSDQDNRFGDDASFDGDGADRPDLGGWSGRLLTGSKSHCEEADGSQGPEAHVAPGAVPAGQDSLSSTPEQNGFLPRA